jgi:two-component system response regulator FlrC
MRLLIIGQLNSDVVNAIDIAKSKGASVVMLETLEESMNFLREGKGADLVLVDVKFDVKSLVDAMLQEHISTPVIGYGTDCSPKDAVNAIRAGAKEFLPLPPDETLIAAIFTAISNDAKPVIANSQSMKNAIAIAEKIAPSDANVLITGKSGTGKEVMANYIHTHSKRNNKPFVRVNCAAIPEALLESELFGHEKGAFTGAIARRIGKFEESSGGTLLLDEISEMDIKLQAKLLRAIQEKEIDRVGGTAPIKVDLRIIATSNRNLQAAIKEGSFREDLYFRLNIINIELPRLQDRHEDLEPLSKSFIEKYVKNNKLATKVLSSDALKKIKEYSWPGNVRELENTIHRAVLLSDGNEIKAIDINLSSQEGDYLETQLIANTVNYCLGDINQAANILGISVNILKEKLDKI